MAFYRDVDDQYCQGDLIDGVPSIHLKAPLRVVIKRTLEGGRQGWEIPEFESLTPQQRDKLKFKDGEQVPAFCQLSRAIVLTHGCEIDKDDKHRLLALVRPLKSLPPDGQDIIRKNQKFSFFYMPADASRNIEECYVDFRRITCVAPGLLIPTKRVASLADDAVAALQVQLYRYLTRREIREGTFAKTWRVIRSWMPRFAG